MASLETKRLLQRAIELAQAGYRDDARPLLKQVVLQDPSLALAWLWLAAISSDDQERIGALQRVLALDPTNSRAKEALEALGVVEGQMPMGENPAVATPVPVPTIEPKPSGPLLSMTELAIIGIVVLAAIMLVGSLVVIDNVVNRPTDTPTVTNTATRTITPTPSDTPTPLPTATPLPPRPTLPPPISATPTVTPGPTNTRSPITLPTASPTPQSEIFGG